MKTLKLSIALSIILLSFSCKKNTTEGLSPKETNSTCANSVTGTIHQLDGCPWVVSIDNGQTYPVYNITNFTTPFEGQRIEFTYNILPDTVGPVLICMAGPFIELTCFEDLTPNSPCTNSVFGTIHQLDGCPWVVELDNGQHYPVNITAFTNPYEGQRINFSYILHQDTSGLVNVCMAGDYWIEITCFNDENSNNCENKVTGILTDYTGLDGCGYVIRLLDGTKLEATNLSSFPNITIQDGQVIEFAYDTNFNSASICMVGTMVDIICAENSYLSSNCNNTTNGTVLSVDSNHISIDFGFGIPFNVVNDHDVTGLQAGMIINANFSIINDPLICFYMDGIIECYDIIDTTCNGQNITGEVNGELINGNYYYKVIDNSGNIYNVANPSAFSSHFNPDILTNAFPETITLCGITGICTYSIPMQCEVTINSIN